MDTFIICNRDRYLYSEYVAYYFLHPLSTIRAKRVSPFFIYSEEYGYIKSFDDVLMKPILLEKNSFDSFQFTIKIIERNGGHVQMSPEANAPYLYTLPVNAKVTIIRKEGNYYELQQGGWLNRFVGQLYPKKKNKKVFSILKKFRPIQVMIININHSAMIYPNHPDKKIWEYRSIHTIFKKGFVNNHFVVGNHDGFFPYEDVVPIGYFDSHSILGKIESLRNQPICLLCTTNPINTVAIHGDFSHSFCCYNCSTFLNSKTCPICRLPIEKIVMNYTISVTNEKDD